MERDLLARSEPHLSASSSGGTPACSSRYHDALALTLALTLTIALALTLTLTLPACSSRYHDARECLCPTVTPYTAGGGERADSGSSARHASLG